MQCYICHEPTAETDASHCACKASVHPHCLLKSITLSRSAKCTICQEPIANVQLKQTRRVSYWVCGFATVLFLATFGCCLSSILFVALAVEEERVDVFKDLLICCMTALVLAMIGSRLLQHLLDGNQLSVVHEEYSLA